MIIILFRCAGIQDNFLDGAGTGLAIYLQGCDFHCPGCHNPSLQDKTAGFLYDTNQVLNHLTNYKGFYQSLIFLGGEPMLQPKCIYTLALNSNLINILYTGYPFEDLPNYIKQVMHVVVDGQYKKELKTGSFPASKNQRIFINQHEHKQDFRKYYNADTMHIFGHI